MNEENVNIEFIEEKEDPVHNSPSFFKGFIDGTFLTRKFVLKQMPFFLFIALLGLIYISNRYHADRIRSDIYNLKNDLKELRSEALYTSSELMKLGRQTEVARELKEKGLDLKESIQPPKIIE
jgi:hypothetical protein